MATGLTATLVGARHNGSWGQCIILSNDLIPVCSGPVNVRPAWHPPYLPIVPSPPLCSVFVMLIALSCPGYAVCTPKLLAQLLFLLLLLLLLQGCHGDYEGSESSLCYSFLCDTFSFTCLPHTRRHTHTNSAVIRFTIWRMNHLSSAL